MLATLLCLFVAAAVFCYVSCTKPKGFPPGPKWFPLIGCLPLFYKLKRKLGFMHLALNEMSETYGPIMGLKFGIQKLVVISTNDLVKKALLKEEFNGRPNGFFFKVRSFGKAKGILFVEGSPWSQTRRFTMRHFKTFGASHRALADRVVIEAENLIAFLRARSENGSVTIQAVFDVTVLNVIWTMLAGHRFDYEDPKLNEILSMVHEVFKQIDTLGGVISQIPILRFVIPELSGFKDLMEKLHRFWKFIGDEISEHEKSLPDDRSRDFMDAFLIEMRTRSSAQLGEEAVFDRENLLILCLDLFLAGLKTTSDTLSTIFAFLISNPHWTKILQKELDEVVGRKRSPNLRDQYNLPKIEAFLTEAQRYLGLTPLGLPHRAMKDVMLEGFFIPKDTIIVMNYYSTNMDKLYWDKPEEFRPDRFLDNEGKFRQNNAFMPFGIGKRRCLGEGIARTSLFLIFTYVLHHLDFKLPPDHSPPDLKGQDGFLVSPPPYSLVFTPRA